MITKYKAWKLRRSISFNDINNIKILLNYIYNDIDNFCWSEFEYNITGHTLDLENLGELVYKLNKIK